MVIHTIGLGLRTTLLTSMPYCLLLPVLSLKTIHQPPLQLQKNTATSVIICSHKSNVEMENKGEYIYITYISPVNPVQEGKQIAITGKV